MLWHQLMLHNIEQQIILLKELDMQPQALERIRCLYRLLINGRDLVLPISSNHDEVLRAEFLELLDEVLHELLVGLLHVSSEV